MGARIGKLRQSSILVVGGAEGRGDGGHVGQGGLQGAGVR